jgi:hypothetical protein
MFVIDDKDHDQQHNDDRMARSKDKIPFQVSEIKTPFRSSGYRELEESRVETLHHRSPEVPKCEMPKIQKQAHQPKFWIPRVGGVKSRVSSS